jgi:hypothetical protein
MLPMTRAGYMTLLQTTCVSEYFKRLGAFHDYDTYINTTPMYSKIVHEMTATRAKFSKSFDQIRQLLVDVKNQRVEARESPTTALRQSTGNLMNFTECSHHSDTAASTTPALTASGATPNDSEATPSFLVQLYDDASACFDIVISTEVPLTGLNVPVEYGKCRLEDHPNLMGITISSSIPLANGQTPTHVETLVNMCIVSMKFRVNNVTSWKSYILPRGLALFAALVHRSKRIDWKVNACKLFAKLHMTTTPATILADTNNHIASNAFVVNTIWEEWKANHLALRNLLYSVISA